jgi:hypothetical protein
MIRFRCPKCQQKFSVPEQYIGKALVCTGCETKVAIPDSSTIPERDTSQPPQLLPQKVDIVSANDAAIEIPAGEAKPVEPELKAKISLPDAGEMDSGHEAEAPPEVPVVKSASAGKIPVIQPIKPVSTLEKPVFEVKAPEINKDSKVAGPPAVKCFSLKQSTQHEGASAVHQNPVINQMPAIKKTVPLAGTLPASAPAFTPRKTPEQRAQEANGPLRQPPPLPPPPQTFGNCPKCNAGLLMQDAALCVECGHNLKLGINVRSVAKVRKTGKLGLALVVAGLAALLSGGVWVAIAAATGYEIGWFASIIGLITGGAVCLVVPNERSVRVGLIAMALAFCGWFLGKVFIAQYVYGHSNISSEIAKEIGKENVSDEDAVKYVIMDMQNNKSISQELSEAYRNEMFGVVPPQKLKEDLEFLKKKVSDRVRGMNQKERKKIAVKVISDFTGKVSFGFKILSVFGFMDGIWLLLALSAAYQLGSGTSFWSRH